ncbi:MAG: LicD family protein [Bacteroidales bacterium]|nr:LicD family protein [Bacteroidales bacterium]MBR6226998.1 LicD family protein [Bacteroidales bacterium]
MQEITMDECRQLQLDLLRHFDAFCRKNGLKYSIGEGSLIGAMRHKGFIPWDDDIDVLMVRDEYEKFCALYKDEVYPLITAKTNSEWFERIARIEDSRTFLFDAKTMEPWPNGLWIAIFPVDNYPDEEWKAKLFDLKNKVYAHICCAKHSNKIGKRLITTLMHYFIPKYFRFGHIEERFDKLAQKYNKVNTKRRGQVVAWWAKRPFVCSSSVFDNYIDTPFEDMQVMAFAGYDEYLRCQYGDWTQLPPEEQRVFKHDYIAYWKDR